MSHAFRGVKFVPALTEQEKKEKFAEALFKAVDANEKKSRKPQKRESRPGEWRVVNGIIKWIPVNSQTAKVVAPAPDICKPNYI